MKIIAAIVLIFLVIGGIFLIAGLRTKAPFKLDSKVVINKHEFKVKTASTQKEKEVGLSGIKKIPNDTGMIFPFGSTGFYPFWMRDMKFPIDIIYIKDGSVIQIFSKVPAPKGGNQNLKIYQSSSPADTVLEINSGLSEKYKFTSGNKVEVSPIK